MDAEGWLASELASFGCAACGQPYGEAQIRVIARREELFFVDLSCPHCGSQAVAIVTIQVDGELLGRDDEVPTSGWDKGDELPSGAPAVSVDDVIDAHVLLRDFEGDVQQLIARLDGRAP